MIKKFNKNKAILMAGCALVMSVPLSAFAQNPVNPDRNKPLEITAEESLEWHRSELFFQAKKDVKAVQGATTLYCDDMVAKYRDSKKSNIDIYSIEASGKVRIVSADSKAYGDYAVYNMDKGYAEMTGKNLRLVSEDQNVSARDKFVYWVTQGRLEALGKAVAVRDGDKIEADKLIATFTDSADGKRSLKTLEGVGNVIITTPTETLTGASAYYSVETGLAELKDNVRIMRGDSFLEGERAQVDLNTNISKIFGAAPEAVVSSDDGTGEAGDTGADDSVEQEDGEAATNGRVRAVFYPKNMEALQ